MISSRSPTKYVHPRRNDKVDSLICKKEGFSNFIFYAYSGNLEGIKSEFDLGVNINEQDNDHKTALYHAVSIDRFDICEFLVENGAKIHWGNGDEIYSQVTPFTCSVIKANYTILEMFLKKGVDTNLKIGYVTPMYYATGKPTIIKLLKTYGCNEIKDESQAFYFSSVGGRGQM